MLSFAGSRRYADLFEIADLFKEQGYGVVEYMQLNNAILLKLLLEFLALLAAF
ncbi:MAG: hypothetical protein QNJ54_20920 [Prochloraceae cyanobacterium]|nr:hypothetical protein [Prochloraceae cyanobacterium]